MISGHFAEIPKQWYILKKDNQIARDIFERDIFVREIPARDIFARDIFERDGGCVHAE